MVGALNFLCYKFYYTGGSNDVNDIILCLFRFPHQIMKLTILVNWFWYILEFELYYEEECLWNDLMEIEEVDPYCNHMSMV